jgi:flagellar basal body rod protein FlgF
MAASDTESLQACLERSAGDGVGVIAVGDRDDHEVVHRRGDVGVSVGPAPTAGSRPVVGRGGAVIAPHPARREGSS